LFESDEVDDIIINIRTILRDLPTSHLPKSKSGLLVGFVIHVVASHIIPVILLMEEILHHPNLVNDGINYISFG